MKLRISKVCLFMICIFLSFNVAAQSNMPPAYEIKPDTVFEHDLSRNCWQILEDKSGKLSIDDVIRRSFKNAATAKPDSTLQTYWFRYRLKNTSDTDVSIALDARAQQTDFYVFKDNMLLKHFVTGFSYPWNEKDGFRYGNYIPLQVKAKEEIVIYYRIFNNQPRLPEDFIIDFVNTERELHNEFSVLNANRSNYFSFIDMTGSLFIGFLLFAFFFNLFFFILIREKVYLYFSLYALSFIFYELLTVTNSYSLWDHLPVQISNLFAFLGTAQNVFLCLFLKQFFHLNAKSQSFNRWFIAVICFSSIGPLLYLLDMVINIEALLVLPVLIMILFTSFAFVSIILIILLQFNSKKDISSRILLVDVYVLLFVFVMPLVSLINPQIAFVHFVFLNFQSIIKILVAVLILCFSWKLVMRYNDLKKENAQQALEKERLAKEKEIERALLIEQQKKELEKTVEERTADLKQSLENLKSTQAQLIQSEKMASLGELTAGIAHEIQNPLNFVNNFSDVNKELLEELKGEVNKGNIDEVKAIADDLISNEEKINHHGKRADAIVKGMLQHSRSGTGVKELTDINKLADEYLRLAYHGFKAKEKSFNAEIKSNYDESIGKINIIPQDIGRVLLNLYNNAFYAVNEKRKLSNAGYQPEVEIETDKSENKITITVCDNGNGIPSSIKEKIFQPFFTTKPTGQGTGLGLSLSYDIIKAHGGEIKVETKEGEGTDFIIQIPLL